MITTNITFIWCVYKENFVENDLYWRTLRPCKFRKFQHSTRIVKNQFIFKQIIQISQTSIIFRRKLIPLSFFTNTPFKITLIVRNFICWNNYSINYRNFIFIHMSCQEVGWECLFSIDIDYIKYILFIHIYLGFYLLIYSYLWRLLDKRTDKHTNFY